MAKAAMAPVITGRGTIKRTGERVFTVSRRSGAPGGHLVIVHADRLACDCPASRYGRRCAHRQVVHDLLLAERQAAQEAQKEEMREEARQARDTAILYRDNRPFSLFK